MIYLVKTKDTVRVFYSEDEMKAAGFKKVDKTVSEEEFNSNGCYVRLINGEIVVGKTDDEIEAEKCAEFAELQKQFTDAIQHRLDTFAQDCGYDHILSMATYVTSTNPKFQAEGQYAVEVRDATWQAAYDILNDVLDGKKPMPTLEEVFAALPDLIRPE
jgi:hypothetical protein